MIVRAAQIRSLNANYEAKGNSIVLLYGRDGCEKEAMLRVYLKDKRFFYYRARQASQLEQYRQMAAEVERIYDVILGVIVTFGIPEAVIAGILTTAIVKILFRIRG